MQAAILVVDKVGDAIGGEHLLPVGRQRPRIARGDNPVVVVDL